MNNFVFFNEDTKEYEFVPESGLIHGEVVYNLQFLESISQDELVSIGIKQANIVFAPEGSATNGFFEFSENPDGTVTVKQGYIENPVAFTDLV